MELKKHRLNLNLKNNEITRNLQGKLPGAPTIQSPYSMIAKINWLFKTEDARIKLKRLYPSFKI